MYRVLEGSINAAHKHVEDDMESVSARTGIDRRTNARQKEIRFIRLNEVLAICGKSRSSVYDAIKKGRFPKPVKLHGRSSAWVMSEVEQWAQQCIDARGSEI